MLSIQSLPARQGDALWIEWGDPVRRMIIDMGTESIGRNIRSRIQDLPEDQRVIELLVITHVDQDHIGGILTCLAEADPIPGLHIKDVWFNGWDHLHGRSVVSHGLDSMGPAQGERLSHWLREQTWNKAFRGAPILRPDDALGPQVSLDGELTLQVVGPTRFRLTDFIPVWEEEVHDALRKGSLDHVSPGLEVMGKKGRPPQLADEADLEELALFNSGVDGSEANGSSIALILEHDGKRVLLTGDAYGPDLVDALKTIDPAGPVPFDLVKLPHHGSEKNVTVDLVEKIRTPRWLISTDGTRFKHPDPVAIARLIHLSRDDNPELLFNVRSEFNHWWDRDDWRDQFGYATTFGTEADGVTVVL